MLNRRTPRSSENDEEENVIKGGRKGGGVLPVLAKTKKRRRNKASTLNMRGFIPLFFVTSYVVIVATSLIFLLRYFWNPKHVHTEPSWRGDVIAHPVEMMYPKIIRDPSSYPQLSNEVLDMCSKTLWHTIETTTIVLPEFETFIHTGK